MSSGPGVGPRRACAPARVADELEGGTTRLAAGQLATRRTPQQPHPSGAVDDTHHLSPGCSVTSRTTRTRRSENRPVRGSSPRRSIDLDHGPGPALDVAGADDQGPDAPGPRGWGTARPAHRARRRAGPARPPPPTPPTSGRAPRDTPRRARRARPPPPAAAAARRRRRAPPPPRTPRRAPAPSRRGARRSPTPCARSRRATSAGGAVARGEHERTAGVGPAPPRLGRRRRARRARDPRPARGGPRSCPPRGAPAAVAVSPMRSAQPVGTPGAGGAGGSAPPAEDEAVPSSAGTGPAQRHAAHCGQLDHRRGRSPARARPRWAAAPRRGPAPRRPRRPIPPHAGRPRAIRTWVPTRTRSASAAGTV